MDWSGLVLVLAAALFTYREVLEGFFVQDDYPWLLETRFHDVFQYARAFFRFHPADVYRPLSQETFFWLGQKIFGLQPSLFHGVNLFAHLACAIILFRLLRLFFPLFPCLIGCLFFAVHSAHLRSLFWIAAVSEPMALAFSLSAILIFIEATTRERPGLVFPGIVAMILGLLCKESTLMLPFILAVYCLLLAPRKLKWTVPFFAVSGSYCIAKLHSAVAMAPFQLAIGVRTWKNLSQYLSWSAGFSETLLKSCLGQEPEAWYGPIALAVLATLSLAILFSDKRKLILFSVAWYGLGLQPFLYFKNQSYAYYLGPALAGLAMLTAALIPDAWSQLRWKSLLPASATICLMLGMSYASVTPEGHWWNERSLVGRNILDLLMQIDRIVPKEGRVYICGLTSGEFGILHYGDARQVFGLSPQRFVLVGVDNPISGDPRILSESESIRHSYCYVYRNGHLEEKSDEFRIDPLAFLVVEPEGYLEVPGVELSVTPKISSAGHDTLSIQVRNLNAKVVDVLYSIDGKVMPPIYRWVLDRAYSARVFVDRSTALGRYQFLAVRDSSKPLPDTWIRVDASASVVSVDGDQSGVN